MLYIAGSCTAYPSTDKLYKCVHGYNNINMIMADVIRLLPEFSYQHWGIILGCAIYVMTLGVVGVLFVAGGSLKRLREQEALLKEEGTVGLKRALEPRPMLYDELLEASRCLPAVPTFGQRGSLEGKFVRLTVLDANARKSVVRQLYEASNGLPGLLGPAYDPHTVWRYLPFGPFETEQSMEAFMVLKQPTHGLRFAMIDAEMGKAIGGISLLNNSPSNLKVEIGDMWFHPSYQVGSNHEALLIETIYLLLGNLFSQRYRRVEWLIDVGDPSRGLATSQLGFQHEGILRKHMIVRSCNRDSLVMSIVNTEWKGSVRWNLEKCLYGSGPPPTCFDQDI